MTFSELSSHTVLRPSGRSSAAGAASRPRALNRQRRVLGSPVKAMRRRIVIIAAAAVLTERAIRDQPLLTPQVSIPRRRPVAITRRRGAAPSVWTHPRAVFNPGAVLAVSSPERLGGATARRRALPGHLRHHHPDRGDRHYGRLPQPRPRRAGRSRAVVHGAGHAGRALPSTQARSARRGAALAEAGNRESDDTDGRHSWLLEPHQIASGHRLSLLTGHSTRLECGASVWLTGS
jgi:hypothetical protein